MTGRRKATKSTCVIIIFIILVGEMAEASESSISFSAQQGFKLDIPDRKSYIMPHVYIKHGFARSNKTLNYNIAKQNIISFLHSGKKEAWPCFSILHPCPSHLFPLQHWKVQCKCNDNKNNKQAVLTPHTKILLHFRGMDSERGEYIALKKH